MIELRKVSKAYGSTVAIRETSLAFDAQRTHVLIGASGCGKTTLLRLILGLTEPTSGEVRVRGSVVNAASAESMRHQMGYVVQVGGLFPHLTARDNALLMWRHLSRPATEGDARLESLSKLVQLDQSLWDRFPQELSGGQRQRVSLVRALMLDPPLLLLDEPLGALDPIVRYDVQTELREIFRALSKTVVLVTHDMNEAAYLGDQIHVMDQGSVIQSGSYQDLKKNPSGDFVLRLLAQPVREVNA